MLGGLSAGQTVGVLMIAGVVPSAIIIWYSWPSREKPGVRWFIYAMGAGIGWALTSGLNPLLDGESVSVLLYNLNVFVVALAAICWLLLAVEFTHETHVGWLPFGVLAAVPILTQLLFWTNGTHGLVYAPETTIENGLVVLSPEPLWYISTGYNYLLVLFATGIWVGAWFATSGTKRRQTELFLLSTVILTITGSLFNAEVLAGVESPVAAAIAPLAFILAGGIIAYALTEYRLFRLGPVARKTAVKEMDDGLLTLDRAGNVVDANPAARELLGFEEDRLGRPAAELFEELPTLVRALDDRTDRTELTIAVDGSERDIDLSSTPIEYGDEVGGRIVVLRDITSLKQRQRELDLVTRVLTRVFRHNVRNDMTAIRGYAEVIEDSNDEDAREYATEIIAQSDKLLAQSEKARLIEEVVGAEKAVETIDIAATVDRLIAEYSTEYPDATFDVSVADGLSVRAHRNLDSAVEQLIENALEHHDGTPTVRITARTCGDERTLVIEDDGPGIHEDEIEALAAGREEDLEHGSGIGLWLANWIVEDSGGRLTITPIDDGTRVTLTMQSAE